MNRQRLEQLWDGCRDGALSADERDELGGLLAESDADRALWDAETRWLEAIRAVAPALRDGNANVAPALHDGKASAAPALRDGKASDDGLTPPLDSHQFTEAVLRRWDQGGPVIARIGVRRRIAWGAALAAAAAIAISAALLPSLLAPDTSRNTPVAVDGGPDHRAATDVPDDDPDALVALISSASDTFTYAANQPARLRDTLAATTAGLFNVSTLTDLFDPDVPDPADFVKPVKSKS